MLKSILISGASSGIGKALALELDRQGYTIYAGVRKSADADSLRSQASLQLTPVILDVTLPETIAQAGEEIRSQTGGELFCLINNAGVDISVELEFVPVEDFRHQLEVNLVGQLALTQACLPMLRKSAGRIIFVSSVSGRLATPFNGPYAISKTGLIAMADIFRMELAPWKIAVSVLIVGSVQTPIWEKSMRTAGEILQRAPREARELYGKTAKPAGMFYQRIGQNGMPVERLVRITSRLLEKAHPKEYVFVGNDALAYELMIKLLPIGWRDWLVRWYMGLLRK